MTERDTLIASLTVQDNRGVYFDDGRYIDWSSRADGVYQVEICNGVDDAVQLDASRDDLLALHAALTAHLLTHAA